jgi:hypothetical protein
MLKINLAVDLWLEHDLPTENTVSTFRSVIVPVNAHQVESIY